MKKKLLFFIALLFANGVVNAQTDPALLEVFNSETVKLVTVKMDTTDLTFTSATPEASIYRDSPGNNQMYPHPGGEYIARATIGAGTNSNGRIVLKDDKITMRSSSTGFVKTSIYNIPEATGVLRISFTLDFSTFTGEKPFTMAIGNNLALPTTTVPTLRLISDEHMYVNRDVNYAKDVFGAFRIEKHTTGATTGQPRTAYTTETGATNNTPPNTHLKWSTDNQPVELFINNTANAISYLATGAESRTDLPPFTYHVWSNGKRHGTSDYPKSNEFNETTINGISFQMNEKTLTEEVGISNISFLYNTDPEATLPVTLTSFKAEKGQHGVQLNWNTVSEKDNAYFEVLKSTDGQEFTSIGKIEGAGTSAATKSYSLVDNNPAAGNNYYKLKQVDNNGKEFLYNNQIQVVNFGLTNDDINAFITDNKLSVRINSAHAGNASVELISIVGQKVISENVTLSEGANDFSYDLASLTKGVYIAKISLNGVVKTVKLAN